VPTLRYSDPDGDRMRTLGDVCIVGRDPQCDIVLANDRKVSHRHASVSRISGTWRVEDMQSRNGTYLERGASVTRVRTALPLQQGDVIRIGSTRLTYSAETEADAGDSKAANPQPDVDAPGFEPEPETMMLGKTLMRQGSPPPPPVVAGNAKSAQTDKERIAELERQIAVLSDELRHLRNEQSQ
jgi:pSer/pThr/pTyr-binding forkhead associated (FHA) protein